MSKAATDRFNEALKTLEDYCVQRQTPGAYYAVLNWLQKQPNIPTAKATVGALLSLDTHGPAANDRKLARAYLLVSATCENKSAAVIGTLRQELLKTPTAMFGAMVQSRLMGATSRYPLLSGAPLIHKSLRDHLDGTGFSQAHVTDGVATAKFVLGKAKLMLDSNQCNAVYERWFGAMDQARYNTVKQNISKMVLEAHTKPIVLRYNGENEFGCVNQTNKTEYREQNIISITLGTRFFGPQAGVRPRSNVFELAPYATAVNAMMMLNGEREAAQRAIMREARKYDDVAKQNQVTEAGFRKIDVDIDAKRTALGSAFKDDYVIAYEGTVVHEFSHLIAGTDDVKLDGVTMYGYNLCRYLATSRPARAIQNADNYRLFCDEFLPS